MSATTHRWVVDAIEEHTASVELEDGSMLSLPLALLPTGASSGQVLRVTLEIDAAATKAALAASAEQVKRGRDVSRKRDPGGDIVL